MAIGILIGFLVSFIFEASTYNLGQRLAGETTGMQYFLCVLLCFFPSVVIWGIEDARKKTAVAQIGNAAEGFIMSLGTRFLYILLISAFFDEVYRVLWWIGLGIIPLVVVLGLYLVDKANFEDNFTMLCEEIKKGVLAAGVIVKSFLRFIGGIMLAIYVAVRRTVLTLWERFTTK